MHTVYHALALFLSSLSYLQFHSRTHNHFHSRTKKKDSIALDDGLARELGEEARRFGNRDQNIFPGIWKSKHIGDQDRGISLTRQNTNLLFSLYLLQIILSFLSFFFVL